MQAVKQNIYNLVETLPDSQLIQEENKLYKELEILSISSTSFWDNEIDDCIWNNK